MEFKFNIHSVFKDTISIWKKENIVELSRRDAMTFNKLSEIINALGFASARAQGLGAPVTSVSKLLSSDQKLYVYKYEDFIAAILKVGVKKLFFNTGTAIKEISPLCVLDIYVVESLQRSGIGKKLFDFMIRVENVTPSKIAYDRPSQKLFPFLQKHFGLSSFIPQTNNFVVFNQYFADETITKPFSPYSSINNRPLTSQKSRRSNTPNSIPVSITSTDQQNRVTYYNSPFSRNSSRREFSNQNQMSPQRPSSVSVLENRSLRKERLPALSPLVTPSKQTIQSNSTYPLQETSTTLKNDSPTKSIDGSRYKHTPNRNTFNPILQIYDSPSNNSSLYLNNSPLKDELKVDSPLGASKKRSPEYQRQFYGNKISFG